MIASVVLTGNGVGLPLTGEVTDDGDVAVHLPRTNPPRSVVVGRRDEPGPQDEPYVAFIYFTDQVDHVEFMREHTGGMTPSERLLWLIFARPGQDPEPEAPTEVVNIDGASVIAVDLALELHGYKLYLDERLIP